MLRFLPKSAEKSSTGFEHCSGILFFIYLFILGGYSCHTSEYTQRSKDSLQQSAVSLHLLGFRAVSTLIHLAISLALFGFLEIVMCDQGWFTIYYVVGDDHPDSWMLGLQTWATTPGLFHMQCWDQTLSRQALYQLDFIPTPSLNMIYQRFFSQNHRQIKIKIFW